MTLGPPPSVAALIAILGTTISPYLFFWQASEEVEEKEESGAEGTSTPVDIGAPSARCGSDVLTGMASAVIVMFSIMVAAGDRPLGEQRGRHGRRRRTQAAEALEADRGAVRRVCCSPWGSWERGCSPCPVLAGSTAYALAEAFEQPEGLSKPFRGARGFYLIIGAAMVFGLASNFAGLNPVRALYFSAILNGLAAPPLVLVMLLLSRSEATCGRWTGGRLSTTLMALTFLLIGGPPGRLPLHVTDPVLLRDAVGRPVGRDERDAT